MSSIIIKTLVRALLIFVPFLILSISKATSAENSASFISVGIFVALILVGSLRLSMTWWRERKSIKPKPEETASVGEQVR